MRGVKVMIHPQKCSIVREENKKISSSIVQVNPWEKAFHTKNLNLKTKTTFSMRNHQ